MPGVFISKGMRVAIPPGGVSISFSRPTPPLQLHVHYDVSPTWCQLALQHLEQAKAAAAVRAAAWSGSDEDAKARALEQEAEASMQAIVAAAIALDAFYGVIRSKTSSPAVMAEGWRKNRTARYKRMTEILRRAFRLSPQGTKTLQAHLKEVYRFRNLAVHPRGEIEALLLHPELDVGVEWRFAYFRAVNAEGIVNFATAAIWQLSRNKKIAHEDIRQYAAGLRLRMDELFPTGHPAVEAERKPS